MGNYYSILNFFILCFILGTVVGSIVGVDNEDLQSEHDELSDEILELYDIIEQLNSTITNNTKVNYTYKSIM